MNLVKLHNDLAACQKQNLCVHAFQSVVEVSLPASVLLCVPLRIYDIIGTWGRKGEKKMGTKSDIVKDGVLRVQAS